MKKRIAISPYLPIFVGVITIALWFGWAWYVIARFPDGTPPSVEAQQVAAIRGQFGDMFGGINALFTAIILAGAIYTVWLQHKEIEALKRQQDESKQESARTALLLASTALVNAKSSLLDARYRMARDLQPHIQTMNPQSELAGSLQLMLQLNAQAADKAMSDLEALSKDLSVLVDEIRQQGGNIAS